MKRKYRITFHDGPEGNRSKNVDVLAESFDDARRQAWQMPEIKFREYSDMMIEEVPEGPSVIGIEFEFEMNNPPVYQKARDYLFIKANDEAEALRYYNSHFKGERYHHDAGKTDPDGHRVRGRVIQTYYAAGMRYDADATLDKTVDGLIANATQRSSKQKDADNALEVDYSK